MGDTANVAGEQPELPPYLITGALRQRLDLAHHLIGFGRQILVVCGAPESGRSAFLAQVMAEAPEEWVVIRCNGADLPAPVDLLRAIADTLDPRAAAAEPAYAEGDVAGLRAFLRGRLNLLHAERRRAVLVCDDCDGWQQDHADLLAELAYRHDEVGELRPLVACSQDGAFATILAASTVTNLPQVIDLPPLSPDEALALINLVVPAGAHALTEDTVVAALDAVDGRAGALLHRLSSEAAGQVGTTAPGHQRLRMLAGVALVVIVACGLLAMAWIEQRKARSGPDLIELEVPQPAAPVAVSPAAPDETSQEPVAAVATAADAGRTAAHREPQATPVPAGAATDTVAEEPQAEPARPAAVPESNTPVAAQAMPRADGDVDLRPAKALPQPPAAAPVVATGVSAPVDEDAANKVYSRKWVLTQPDEHYVLQLFGSREQAAARRFIAAHQLDSAAAVFELEHQGGPWFVAVTGMFASRDAARAAAASLPASLRATGAWPRTVATLRK